MTNLWPIVAQSGGGQSPLTSLMPMVLIFLVFYVLWFRPLQKKQKALDLLLSSLQKGDKVITNGGFFGKVVKTEDEVVVLEIADNVRVRVARKAISGLEGNQTENGGK